MIDLKIFFLTFIPIFVAVDALGILPIFISFTEDLSAKERKKLISQSVITASVIAIIFMFVGKAIFQVLGVSVSDFKVAGGTVLLFISLSDILQADKSRRHPSSTTGAVPIGTPLIVGPAVLTTIIMLIDIYGNLPVIISLLVNLFIVWIIFINAGRISKMLGPGGSKALSKVASLLLAAIAVMMIRKGVVDIIKVFIEGR